MTATSLQQWIEHPEQLNRDTLYELRMLLARYPYFQTLRLLYLKNLYLLHDSNFGAELHKSVLYVSDRRMLFYLIEGEKYILRPLSTDATETEWVDEPGVDRTMSLIDAFLASAPQEPQVQPDYVMDYTAYLLEDNLVPESEVPLKGQELIDDFMDKEAKGDTLNLKGNQDEYVEEEVVMEDSDDDCFTETLAKIYIK
ncbi:MAG: tetratricopeptide repeat protein, partial [Mediterranea sp.]|nr:tetratricopeptide repeat protein [Mediterranea sp.]